MKLLWVSAFLLACHTAWAEAPTQSQRPLARPAEKSGDAALPAGQEALELAQYRPKARPEPEQAKKTRRPKRRPETRAVALFEPTKPQRPSARPALPFDDTSDVRLFFASSGPRPNARSANMASIVKSSQSQLTPVRFTRKGSICGINSIKGKVTKSIPGRIRGCGVANPVRVTSVQGVALSTPSTMDCGTAKALNTWVSKSVKPTFRKTGGGVKSIKVVAHYACRTRNNKKGAKISEHGKGRAVDVAGFTLKDGSFVSVLKHWRSKSYGAQLKKVHRSACGPFGTVLGPNADRYHQDHFHFDTARYRSGSYCR